MPPLASLLHSFWPVLSRWFLCALLLISGAHLALYQVSSFAVDAGNRADVEFLPDFREPEQAPPEVGDYTFQWSRAQSEIAAPRVAGRWELSLRLHPVDEAHPRSVTFATSDFSLTLDPPVGLREYHFLLPNLEPIMVRSDLPPTDDPRIQNLGVAVDYVRAYRITAQPFIDWGVVLFGLIYAAFLLVMAYLTRLAQRDTLLTLAGGSVLVLLAFVLQPARVLLVLPLLNLLLVAGGLLGLLCKDALARTFGPSSTLIVASLLISVLVKLGGVFYPGYLPTDALFQANRFLETTMGLMYRVAEGQGQTYPYPTAVYLFLAPFALIYPELRWLGQVAGVLIDSSTILLLAFALKSCRVQPTVINWACFLYAIMPAGFLIQWQGTLAQNIGQWFGICYLTLLLITVSGGQPVSPWRYAVLIVAAFVACLGHFGVFLTVSLMMVMLCVLAPRFAWRHRAGVATWFGGAALSGLLYYSAFVPLFLAQTQNLTMEETGQSDLRLFLLRRFVWELGIYNHYQLVYVVLALCALFVLLRSRPAHITPLLAIYGAMLATSLLLGVLNIAILFNPTRYMIFAFPAIVVFAAFGIHALSRYRLGWMISRVLVAYTLFVALSMWAAGFALQQRIGWLL